MGYHSWSSEDFEKYTTEEKGMSLDIHGLLSKEYSSKDVFTKQNIDESMRPYNILRECRISDSHPIVLPVILAIDVTGSMGSAATEVARVIGSLMSTFYEKVECVQILIMAIGDIECDHYPLQVGQFEADIQVAKDIDKIYFEGCGGGNRYESYTLPWYFGAEHCDLDCWKNGSKGVIITMGDEMCNPYIPGDEVHKLLGNPRRGVLQFSDPDIETSELYDQASNYYNIYHIFVEHGSRALTPSIRRSYEDIIGKDHFKQSTVSGIGDVIMSIILREAQNQNQIKRNNENIEENAERNTSTANSAFQVRCDENGEVIW